MARIFIFDSCPDRIRTLYYSLSGEGHDVQTNLSNINAPVSRLELDPTRAVRKIWTSWQGQLPDIIIMDCLDVDSAKFLEELHRPFFKSEVCTIVMTPYTSRANGLLRRLMSGFGVFCMERPFAVHRFLDFVQQSTPTKRSAAQLFQSGVVFD